MTSSIGRFAATRRRLAPTVSILLVLAFCAAGAFAEDASLSKRRAELDPMAAGLSVRERLAVLVERVKLEQNNVKSMSAKFRQDKTSAMLLEPSVDSGVFYYRAPDKVRWEYRQPEPMLVVINGEELLTFYQEQKRAERASIGDISEQVFKYLGASGSLDKLAEFFEVTAYFPERAGEAFHLVLEPRYSRIERRLKGMEIWIDPITYQPTKFKYLQPGGDETTYQFDDLVLNGELKDELFEVELPADVQVKTIDLKKRGG